MEPSDVIEQSEQHLKDLLVQLSNPEKLHHLNLLHHGHSSMNLPDYNSVNFKCQQNQLPVPVVFKDFFHAPKKVRKLSEEATTTSNENEMEGE